MAVMKGVNPTKGNPRPATKPPTAKPLVPAKPLVAAGTGGTGSERNALKRSNSITTPTQMLRPGTRLPLTPNQGSRLYNPSVGARPQGGGILAGLERSMGTGFGLSNNPAAMNALGSADRAVQQQIQALQGVSLPNLVSGVTSGTSPIQQGARDIAQGASQMGQDILNWMSELNLGGKK